MKKLASIALAIAAVSLSAPASAQFAKAEDAIKYRQSAFFVMQQNFSRVAAMAAGKAPFDAKVAADSAAVAEFTAKLPWAGFGEGTDKGRDNRAKAEIWSDWAKFNDSAEKMQLEMTKLNAAAKTGNLDAIKTAVGAVGGTCKTCHDAFRKD
jgi:cytochrome c556